MPTFFITFCALSNAKGMDIKMAKIISAYLDYPALTVNLDNGQDIFIFVTQEYNPLPFAKGLTPKSECKPRTDGTTLYWKDGTKLTLDEIMAVVEGSSI